MARRLLGPCQHHQHRHLLGGGTPSRAAPPPRRRQRRVCAAADAPDLRRRTARAERVAAPLRQLLAGAAPDDPGYRERAALLAFVESLDPAAQAAFAAHMQDRVDDLAHGAAVAEARRYVERLSEAAGDGGEWAALRASFAPDELALLDDVFGGRDWAAFGDAAAAGAPPAASLAALSRLSLQQKAKLADILAKAEAMGRSMDALSESVDGGGSGGSSRSSNRSGSGRNSSSSRSGSSSRTPSSGSGGGRRSEWGASFRRPKRDRAGAGAKAAQAAAAHWDRYLGADVSDRMKRMAELAGAAATGQLTFGGPPRPQLQRLKQIHARMLELERGAAQQPGGDEACVAVNADLNDLVVQADACEDTGVRSALLYMDAVLGSAPPDSAAEPGGGGGALAAEVARASAAAAAAGARAGAGARPQQPPADGGGAASLSPLQRVGRFIAAAERLPALQAWSAALSEHRPGLLSAEALWVANLQGDDWFIAAERRDAALAAAEAAAAAFQARGAPEPGPGRGPASVGAAVSAALLPFIDEGKIAALAALNADLLYFLAELEASGHAEDTVLRWSLHPRLGPRLLSGELLDAGALPPELAELYAEASVPGFMASLDFELRSPEMGAESPVTKRARVDSDAATGDAAAAAAASAQAAAAAPAPAAGASGEAAAGRRRRRTPSPTARQAVAGAAEAAPPPVDVQAPPAEQRSAGVESQQRPQQQGQQQQQQQQQQKGQQQQEGSGLSKKARRKQKQDDPAFQRRLGLLQCIKRDLPHEALHLYRSMKADAAAPGVDLSTCAGLLNLLSGKWQWELHQRHQHLLRLGPAAGRDAASLEAARRAIVVAVVAEREAQRDADANVLQRMAPPPVPEGAEVPAEMVCHVEKHVELAPPDSKLKDQAWLDGLLAGMPAERPPLMELLGGAVAAVTTDLAAAGVELDEAMYLQLARAAGMQGDPDKARHRRRRGGGRGAAAAPRRAARRPRIRSPTVAAPASPRRAAQAFGYAQALVDAWQAAGRSAKLTPRLRDFQPALVGYALTGQAEQAGRVIELMRSACGQDLTESEFALWLEAIARGGSYEQLEEALAATAAELNELRPATLALIARFFESERAAAALAAGGKLAGLGRSAWQQEWVTPSEEGLVAEAGVQLGMSDLSEADWAAFAQQVRQLAEEQEKQQGKFTVFADWLEKHGPFDVMIDGANVALWGENYEGGGFRPAKIRTMVDAVRAASPGAKILLVLHAGRHADVRANHRALHEWLESLRRGGEFYVAPAGSNDDWYWLYATVAARARGLLVSNDQLRDHVWSLLRPKHMLKWAQRHIVRFSFNFEKTQAFLAFPLPYTPCVQHDAATGAWLLPSGGGGGGAASGERRWLCCRAAGGRGAAGLQQPRRGVWGEPPALSEARRAESFYDSTVEKYAEMPLVTLTLEHMLRLGRNAPSDPSRVVQSAQFVQEELPKRLARRLLDLQLLPHLVVTNPHIKRVYTSYYHAFETLRRHPRVECTADDAPFCALLRRLVDEHGPLLDLLARGLAEVRAKRLVGRALELDNFLDAMLRSRISRRVMAEQHLHLTNARPGFIGSIATALDVAGALGFAGERARQVCSEAYGVAPEVELSGDLGARLPYLPGHLDYMTYELLKNAMRAVVERHRGATHSTRSRLPAIQARVCSGGGHLTICISDQGGGIPPEHRDQVWSYGFTTSAGGAVPELQAAQQELQHADAAFSGGAGAQRGAARRALGGRPPSACDQPGRRRPRRASQAPAAARLQRTADAFGALLAGASDAARVGRRFSLAGLGFGLPMSRLHARFWGGDLQLVNLPGYGVDAFLTLRRLDSGAWSEQLDDDAGAAGQAAAVGAALKVQQQLRGRRAPGAPPAAVA
ncbi:hypothetical protein HT031_001382 [Scenedesmus sp. PABB004]|nr:hypothetical protein HT031_001382 [Scenedesmus sp. PABB004]